MSGGPHNFQRSGANQPRVFRGRHRAEHWYRDNQVYFLTNRCRGRYPAFASEEAKTAFWNVFEQACAAHGFYPWATSLLDNHYHTMGYLRRGEDLPRLAQKIHGGAAFHVNQILQAQVAQLGLPVTPPLSEPGKLRPFWKDSAKKNYFDGCLRDETQARRTYRYIAIQPVRHGVCDDPADYPHTKLHLDMDRAIARALELGAFMEGVPYKRYQKSPRR